MCVSVCVTPGTLFSRPGITSASSSWPRTRIIATRSNSPVTEYTSLTSANLGDHLRNLRDPLDVRLHQNDRGDHSHLLGPAACGLRRARTRLRVPPATRRTSSRVRIPSRASRVSSTSSTAAVARASASARCRGRRRHVEERRQRRELAIGYFAADQAPAGRPPPYPAPGNRARAARTHRMRPSEAEVEGCVVRGEHASVREFQQAGSASAARGAVDTSWLLIPVSASISAGTGTPGSTSVQNSPVTRPARSLTAPISVIRASAGDQPVVSTSTTANSICVIASARGAARTSCGRLYRAASGARTGRRPGARKPRPARSPADPSRSIR